MSGSRIGVVVPLELVGVRVEIPANTPMVLLREQEGRHRLLPIYIGSPEASAIHSLMRRFTGELSAAGTTLLLPGVAD